jgi:tripartite ATP-independent transporter DctM subunit
MMNAGGITHHLVRLASAMVGHMRGGLAQANIVSNTLMAGLSGSSLAVAVGTAKALIPEMEKRGYDRNYACAITSAASTIDNLIPPSIGLIVFAAVGSVSVGALFTAGIVPGVVMAFALMLVVHVQAKKRGYELGTRAATLRERALAFRDALPALLVPVLIVGGMRAGAFTASEAGAMAVLYATVIGLVPPWVSSSRQPCSPSKGPDCVPVPIRSPGRRLQPPSVWCASICAIDQ